MKKFLAILLTVFLMSGIALAEGSMTLRGSNNSTTGLTNYDYRVIYETNISEEVSIKIDTLDASFGGTTTLNSNIVELTAKRKVLGMVDVIGRIGPGQAFDADGAIVNRNYNGIGLILPLGVNVDYSVLTPSAAGSAVVDEISASLVVLGINFQAYDLRQLGTGDRLKFEADTFLKGEGIDLALRYGLTDNANKFGTTVSTKILGINLAGSFDSVAGNYTLASEQIRTADCLGLPIINWEQVLSLSANTEVIGIDLTGSYLIKSNDVVISDVKAQKGSLMVQYRDTNINGNISQLLRAGLTFGL